MSIKSLFMAGLLATAALIPLDAAAQPGGRGGGGRPGGGRLPAPGTLLPDITVFDDAGNEFSTKVLREHHTVLVFGCLT